jgi:hypothetical protein
VGCCAPLEARAFARLQAAAAAVVPQVVALSARLAECGVDVEALLAAVVPPEE